MPINAHPRDGLRHRGLFQCYIITSEAIGDVKLLKWTAGLGMLGPYPMFMLVGTKGMLGIVLGVPRTTFAHRASTRSYAVMRLGILGLITLGQVTLTSAMRKHRLIPFILKRSPDGKHSVT